MKRFTTYTSKAATLLLSAVVCVTAYAGNPQKRLMKREIKKPVLVENVKSAFTPSPLKAAPNKASSTVRDILIDEDFSAVMGGTVNNPDTTVYLASSYYEPGIYIDPSLTKDGTWGGDFVHPAGGAVCLYSPHPMRQAALYTPLGDYSGKITVTCKVKAIPAWYVYDVDYETGENIYACSTGASLNIRVCTGGYDSYDTADTDMYYSHYDTRLYVDKGWTEVELTFDNYSANSDGYIVFYTEGAVILDDIKVVTEADFIASPAIIGVTDFQKDQLTVEWQPVRKAYNYYIDFYKRVYTSESGLTLSENFENGIQLEDLNSTSTAISDTEGVDGSKAVILYEGDTLTTPNVGAAYQSGSFYLKFVTPNEESYYAVVNLDVLKDGKWENDGYFYLDSFTEGDVINLEEEFYDGFANKYQAIRLRPEDLSEGEYVIIDDINFVTNRPFVLERVIGPNSLDYGGYEGYENYVYYDTTKKTSFTFTDLDPETEYYYGIRSHYVSLFSDFVSYHAFGVSAPEVLPATDIDSRGSFTANWNPAPKATGYTVDLYGVYKAEADVENFPLIDEDFSKIDESVTTITDPYAPMSLYNYEDTPLDEYTKQPGWVGFGTTVAVGMLGCEAPYYYYTDLTMPEIYVGNDDEVSITIKAYGVAGDNLIFKVGDVRYAIPFNTDADGNGYIDGSYMIPVTTETIRPVLSTYNYGAFMLDYISVNQNLKAGDVVKTRLETVDAEADATSYTFNNLADYAYDQFGYTVTSVFELEGKSTTSVPSETIVVNLVTGDSGVSTGIADAAADNVLKVVGRYGIDGKRISAPQKGVNILKMSDGSVRKVLVK